MYSGEVAIMDVNRGTEKRHEQVHNDRDRDAASALFRIQSFTRPRHATPGVRSYSYSGIKSQGELSLENSRAREV